MAALATKNRKKVSQTNELAAYYKQISERGLLTAEEEIALARRIEAGDESACQELAEANLRLVVKLARKFRHPDLTLADLVQEAREQLAALETRVVVGLHHLVDLRLRRAEHPRVEAPGLHVLG